MISNILSVCFLMVLLYVTILYKSSAACALMLLLLLCMVLGLGKFLYAVFCLKFRFPTALAKTFQKDTCPFTILVKNTGFFPVSGLSMDLYLLDAQKNLVQSSVLRFCASGKKITPVSGTITSELYGKFQIAGKHLRLHSPFSLLQFPLPGKFSCQVFFYPTALPLDVQVKETTRYFAAESQGFEEILPGGTLLPSNEIREFLPGDKMRQIHWKLSARTGSLLVRDPGRPEGFPVLVFLQLQALHTKDSARQFSRFLEFTVSLSFSLLEARCNHLVIWFDAKNQSLVRYPVRTEEEHTLCIYALLHETLYEDKKDLYDFYAEEYPCDTYCTRLLLCTDLTLGFDTQSPCPFTNDMTIPV
ncbi:DUF58 domain-containing protein [Blautia sp.]|uniref:DUF58 domain-containing protein n=1 Tax=Blautia sp. TaxID=1955243 RepID=UPI0026049C50|nr:DUF58 domain-containing protein [Blautia sp.]